MLTGRVSIDLDATDVEVYAAAKQGVAYNYLGQRCGRPHLATWAGTGLTLAADLLTGTQDVRAHSSALLGRAVAALPTEVRISHGFGRSRRTGTSPTSRRRLQTCGRPDSPISMCGLFQTQPDWSVASNWRHS